jgi:hypothetical protein
MKAKAARLMVLAAVCTVALWPPAISSADYPPCPSQYCGFWRNVCENTGTYVQTSIGYCLDENDNLTVLFDSECTYTWRGPWTMQCTGI